MIKDAIVQRFEQPCKDRKISGTELARLAGMTTSTVYRMLEPERRDLGVITVKKLCARLGISMTGFFDAQMFPDLSQAVE